MKALRRKRSGKRSQNRLAGGFAFIEVALASVIISLLILSFLAVLNMTMKGTISAKWRNQALQLAKDRVELIKADIVALSWEDILVDKEDNYYNAYPPVTVVLGTGQSYVVDATVRYVNLHGYDEESDPSSAYYKPTFVPPDGSTSPDMGEFRYADSSPNTWSANHIVYVSTPEPSSGDLEYSEVVLVRVDVYWFQGRERGADVGLTSPPHPFAGMNTVSLENVVSNRKIKAPSGTIQVFVFEKPVSSGIPVAGANVYLYRADNDQQIDLITSKANGEAFFENVPASPPNYYIVSKDNEGIQYGDDPIPPDPRGPSGQPTGGYVITAGVNAGGLNDKLALDKLTGATVSGVVMATDPDSNPIPVVGAVVVCNDIFSAPTTTNASGVFQFSGANQVEIGTDRLFWANVYSASQSFLVGGVTMVGAQGGPATLTVVADPGNTTPLTINLTNPYENTNFIVHVQDSEGNCLGGSFPVAVRVSDGSPFSGYQDAGVVGNYEEDGAGADCYVTLGLVTGTHIAEVLISDGGLPDWKPMSAEILFNGSPGAYVSIGNGVPPIMMPDIQAVATAAGSVTGFASFDYSIFQVGLYTADPSEDFVYSFALEANGVINHQYVPVEVGAATDYHIKLITGPEYSTDPVKLSNIEFNQGAPTTLGAPAFTIYKDRAYITGRVENSLSELINTGVMVLAIPAGQAAPTVLSAGLNNLWSTTSTEDGRFFLPIPVAVSGSTYDLYGYHLPRKLSPGAVASFTSTVRVGVLGVAVLPSHSLTAPLTVDFTGGDAFAVAPGYH